MIQVSICWQQRTQLHCNLQNILRYWKIDPGGYSVKSGSLPETFQLWPDGPVLDGGQPCQWQPGGFQYTGDWEAEDGRYHGECAKYCLDHSCLCCFRMIFLILCFEFLFSNDFCSIVSLYWSVNHMCIYIYPILAVLRPVSVTNISYTCKLVTTTTQFTEWQIITLLLQIQSTSMSVSSMSMHVFFIQVLIARLCKRSVFSFENANLYI